MIGNNFASKLCSAQASPEAEPLLLEGYRGLLAFKDRIAVPDHYYDDLARNWVVEAYQRWGKPEKVAEWR